MQILFAVSEVYPLAKTGGLADVAGSLPKALNVRGHEVSVIMPRYGSVRGPAEPLGNLQVAMGDGKVEKAGLLRTWLDAARRVPVYLVDHPQFFGERKGLYGFPDDGWRFVFFSRAVIEAIRQLSLKPDIIHCHDWHTGMVPAYLKLLHPADLGKTACVFTIHNLMYQGIWGREVMAYSGLPWSAFSPQGLEFYGNLNCLKAGIVYSERVNTVSPTYAREIQTAEHGHGLDGLLHHEHQKLSGIVNGIDYEVWNPEHDTALPVRFGPGELERKAEMKKALLKEVRLPAENGRPLFSFVGRLVDQKGMNLIMANLSQMRKEAQLVILGTGDPAYHERLSAVGGNGSLAIFLKYDEELAHRIYAGSDGFLMPSWFEPCGLGQLIALRYGTLPVVRRTGGLSDTVRDADRDPSRGTGFAFEEYRPEPLADAFRRALRAFHEQDRWSRLVEHAMAQDFSWEASTEKYEELYRLARG